MPPRPPQRWEEYQALGSVIPGTKFIAFKVPLKQMICDHLPEGDSFSPEELVQSVKKSGKSLGLVVDLTYTCKYYDGEQSFAVHEIQYEKIFTEGHRVPSDAVVQRFGDVVDEFSSRNTDEDVVIGVHCTHGVNRTGYLVCRYMIEKLNIDPEEAISLFGEARGHPIERENYICDLKTRPNPSANEASSEDSTSNCGPLTDRPYSPTHRKLDKGNYSAWDQPYGYQGQEHDRGQWSRMDAHTSSNRSHSVGYQNYQNGGNFHRKPHSLNTCNGPPVAYQGYGRGHSFRSEGHPYRGGYASGKGPQQGSQGQDYGRGRSYRGHSSPLDSYEGLSRSGWGSAAKSGWGSSQSQGGWGHRDRGYNHNSDHRWVRGGSGHNPHRNYSWQKPNSSDQQNAGSGRGGFRDRMGHVGAGSNRGKGFGGTDSSRAADMNWRRRNPDERRAGLGEQGAAGYRDDVTS